jgi:uncharacterized protein YidB (DUF937 family)
MGLFDGLASELGSVLGAGGEGQSANVIGSLLSSGAGDQAGGISGMLETMAANGLAEHVAAWTSGENLPISTDQIRDALGSDQVQQMAQASGLPVGDFLKTLAAHLPTAVAATAS